MKKAKCEVKYLETTQLGRQMIPYKGKRLHYRKIWWRHNSKMELIFSLRREEIVDEEPLSTDAL